MRGNLYALADFHSRHSLPIHEAAIANHLSRSPAAQRNAFAKVPSSAIDCQQEMGNRLH